MRHCEWVGLPYTAYMEFLFQSETSEPQTKEFVLEQPSWPSPKLISERKKIELLFKLNVNSNFKLREKIYLSLIF